MVARMKLQVNLRIVVVDPPPGAVFAVQRGRAGLLAPVNTDAGTLTFEFPVSVADVKAEPPRLTGEFAQGPPAGRFVYVNSGSLAGQALSFWTRRAKVPLAGITWEMLQSALVDDGWILEARINGRARDGGPACGSVPLPTGWALVDRAAGAA